MFNKIQVLRQARDLLKKQGWTQGALKDDNGKHCALGAIFEVLGMDLDEMYDTEDYDNKRSAPYVELLALAIKNSKPGYGIGEEATRTVYRFNDSRTEDEVLKAFNDAIRLAKQSA